MIRVCQTRVTMVASATAQMGSLHSARVFSIGKETNARCQSIHVRAILAKAAHAKTIIPRRHILVTVFLGFVGRIVQRTFAQSTSHATTAENVCPKIDLAHCTCAIASRAGSDTPAPVMFVPAARVSTVLRATQSPIYGKLPISRRSHALVRMAG